MHFAVMRDPESFPVWHKRKDGDMDTPAVKEITTSKVWFCNATDCSYNAREKCHAVAITIGNAEGTPYCDTRVHGKTKAGVEQAEGLVGACKVDDCIFNEALECVARGVRIKNLENNVECRTFRRRI
jgi:hypothetical protein